MATVGLAAHAYAPLLVHFAQHAFAGLGPSIAQDLSNHQDAGRFNNLATTIGAHLIVGGWLGG